MEPDAAPAGGDESCPRSREALASRPPDYGGCLEWLDEAGCEGRRKLPR